MMRSETRRFAIDLIAVTAVKALVGGLVLAGGFRAVSDDDFARVVLSQRFAAEPRLDPSGSSWLPLPFWVYGAVMRIAGTDLWVARATAFALGLAAAALVYAAGRLLFEDPRDARLGAIVAAILPWSARLGVATVPELPTAALVTFAVATLTRPRFRILGALALLAASLSRYEPWPVAIAFAALCLWDANGAKLGNLGGGLRARPGNLVAGMAVAGMADNLVAGMAALVAMVGPALWMAHNAVSHGSALHFASRVSRYWQAVGGEPAAALAYPLGIVREEPELCIVAVGLLIAGGRHPTLRRTAAVMGFALVALTVAALPGAAPTHHAGRSLLPIWLLASLYLGAGMRRALLERPSKAAALVAGALCAGMVVRTWAPASFQARVAETRIGAAAAEHLPAGARALLEAEDYGYFAVMAASGRPALLVLDRSLDPRQLIAASSFAEPARVRERAREVDAGWVIGRVTPATQRLGAPAVRRGGWALWQLAP